MKESFWWPVIVVCALMFGFAVVVFQAPKTVVVSSEQAQEWHRLSVSGDAKLEVAADQATVYVRIEVMDADPRVAQDKASVVGMRAVDALRSAGVDTSAVETTDYQIYLVREWNPKIQVQEEKGYRVSHLLKVKTTQLDKIGIFLKLVVDAGVNGVERVEFDLSNEKQKEIKQQALSAATRVAREKAEVLADSLGVQLGKVVSISESSFGIYPVANYLDRAYVAAEAAPPIRPGEVTAQVSVSVVFEIS